MDKLEAIARSFCTANIGQQEINFNAFKNPESLYKQFGERKRVNSFQPVEKPVACHCEEQFLRRSNL